MRFRYSVFVCSLLLLLVGRGIGQDGLRYSKERYAKVVVADSMLFRDAYTIVPGSVSITPDVAYRVANDAIILVQAPVVGDTIMISYRVFSFNLETPFFVIDSTLMERQDIAITPGYKYNPYRGSQASILGARDLNYAGSFSRGFSVGNAQSLVLNSNFNLQLAGEIGDGIKILAAISDDNIPIQPEGNTQVLQEFDRVFIQISKEETSVIAGDYNLVNNAGYFMRYNKRLQGISAQHSFDIGDHQLTTKASAAAARGKFSRQTIATQEGNQGPYKLQGNNGERFLIIQSGSERVYIDGRLVQRGFEYDYTIDYNRAEVTFTPTRIITKDERVVIEFEYADQSYLRTAYAVDNKWSSDRWSAYVNMYSEQDSRTSTGTLTLDSTDVGILAAAGDDPLAAVRSGIRPVLEGDNSVANRIRYTIELREGDTILVFAANPALGNYTATFSEVPAGSGDYEIAEDLDVNGRVYRYVGRGQGTYMPDIQLVAPEQLQMVTAGAALQIGSQGEIRGEVALSNTDANRLSVMDDGDNLGLAGQVSGAQRWRLSRDSSTWLGVSGYLEAVDSRFDRLNPYRAQEFARDWNLTSRSSSQQEYLYGLSMSLQRKTMLLSHVYDAFDRGDIYSGDKHVSRLAYRGGGYTVDIISNILSARDTSEQFQFYRPKVTLAKQFSRLADWTITLYSEVEHNEAQPRGGTDLSSQAFSYDLSRFIVNSPQSDRFSTSFKVTYRRDRLPDQDKEWVEVSRGTSVEAQQAWQISEGARLQWSIGSRRLDVSRPDLLITPAKNTLLGRLDYEWRLFGGAISTTTSYNLDAGQEPKLEFVYFQVENPDLGEYVYLGQDAQGLDQSLFVYMPSDPRSLWRRASQFNNEFILTNNQSLNQSLRLDFRRFWAGRPLGKRSSTIVPRSQSGTASPVGRDRQSTFRSLVSRISLISNLRYVQKTADTEQSGFGLRAFDLQDTTLISGSRLINNTLYFNKGHNIYDVQVGNRSVANKIVQIAGADLREQAAFFSRVRVNVKRYLDVIVVGETGTLIGDSEQFDNRDFEIDYWEVEPSISYRPTGAIRIKTAYKYSNRQQVKGVAEQAISQDWSIGGSFRKASTESLDLSITYVGIDYDGAAGSVVEFEMLNGLQDGRNVLWDLSYIRRLGNNVDLSLSYEGRKSGDNPLINIGRAQVKATF